MDHFVSVFVDSHISTAPPLPPLPMFRHYLRLFFVCGYLTVSYRLLFRIMYRGYI